MTGRALSALRVARREEWERIVRRACKGVTRAVAAERMGVTERTVQRWERELGMHRVNGGARVGAGRHPNG